MLLGTVDYHLSVFPTTVNGRGKGHGAHENAEAGKHLPFRKFRHPTQTDRQQTAVKNNGEEEKEQEQEQEQEVISPIKYIHTYTYEAIKMQLPTTHTTQASLPFLPRFPGLHDF